ncbi:MAG TPA: heavy metal translocating P-type ATPase metal-binding domain-containing protein [Chryseolinea sp.]|nr:heavy metal translocating P-type ATPase metal-binding domain-containing protein [Chryseolinea sp.]
MTQVEVDLKCFHCGQSCDEPLWTEAKPFCCYGCKTVYEILSSNNLCEYYDLDKNPGVQLKHVSEETYAYLDEIDIRKKVLDFDSENFAKVTLFIPSIHCVSCIWLLENLQKIADGILHSEVVFTRKTVSINFNPKVIKVSTIARLLTSVGYIPKITLDSTAEAKPKEDNSLVLKMAIAGFCFGNVMLFSFPEYLGIDHSEEQLMRVFSWLNLALSIPVFFFSGFDYIKSAFKSFKQKQINIDLPIAAGLIALFLRSSYDIITATGPGYLDSFTGLVFFLLIGRWFQDKTYKSLAFDRDFTAYFPLAVNVMMKDGWKPLIIYKLKRGDQIRIRNMEIIPADAMLLSDFAYIDYSFVTGESRPAKVMQTDLVYAGGRLIGSPVELIVEKETSQSHLTSLWNNDAFKKVEENKYQKLIDRAAQKFTWAVLLIAAGTTMYWQINDPKNMWLVLTSVLMVACPCALALAAPFTFGSMLRVFGKNKLYLKNADAIERMVTIDAIVFDKTGTITHGKEPDIKFEGALSETDFDCIKTLTSYSTHPLSLLITQHIKSHSKNSVSDFKEITGKGIEGTIEGRNYKIGSPNFVGFYGSTNSISSQVFVAIDDEVKGYFRIKNSVRPNIESMINRLGNKCAALLSGDNESDRNQMQKLFGNSVEMLFNQSPHDKLQYIKSLQAKGKKVMMIGDGLNDAGALKQSDVGIAVTDDTGVFTPACDGILSGEEITSLDKMLQLAKSSSAILKTGFAISFFYNAITLSIAVSGNLTPLVAAILMPISSISVVGFSVLAVNLSAKTKLKIQVNTIK